MSSEKMNLTALQSNMKVDPEGYSLELSLLYNQFKSSLELFQQQAALNFTSLSGIAADTSVVNDLGDRTMFLAHVTSFYPKELSQFPTELLQFLKSSARNLLSGLRLKVTKSLILLQNRKMIDIAETLVVFLELQTLGDGSLRQLAYSHVIQSIRRMNQKHKNYPKNKALQNILFGILRQEEEAKAKQALITLCDLHRRKVWFDESTANAICMACFHPSSRIMAATLSILLDFEKIEDGDPDDSDSGDGQATLQPLIVLNKEAVYKASHKGTTSSKKKKKLKLRRIARSMKKQQRLSSEKSNSNYCSPLIHLKDAQGFAEKLLYCLQSCKERIEVKMRMLQVIARTIGLYHLILLEFYTYLERYVEPRKPYITTVLAAAVQACHEMVPPDAVKQLHRTIVTQLVHDQSPPEDITVGLNVVREICLRMPLLMTGELLQDLVLYKKSHNKAISSASRSLYTLFKEICPSLLARKDRGRPAEVKAKLKAFGEVHVASNVPFAELLEQGEIGSSEDIDGKTCDLSAADENQEDDSVHLVEEDGSGEDDEVSDVDVDEINKSADGATEICDKEESEENTDDEELETDGSIRIDADIDSNIFKEKKRKFSDFEGQLNAADTSVRALKKLVGTTEDSSSSTYDGILSNEDFQRINELKAKKEARTALTQHGFKLTSSGQLSMKRVDAATLEAHIKRKLSKEEKLALIRDAREERGKYQARAAIKKKKTGGLSNREKEHEKLMPSAARKAKIGRTRRAKKIKQQRSGKQFRGRKAWK